MASSKEYLEFILDQLSGLENVSYRAMMGEYILYCGGKKADWVLEAFPDREGEENSFHEGIVSRTSQIIPRVTEVIEKYML